MINWEFYKIRMSKFERLHFYIVYVLTARKEDPQEIIQVYDKIK